MMLTQSERKNFVAFNILVLVTEETVMWVNASQVGGMFMTQKKL